MKKFSQTWESCADTQETGLSVLKLLRSPTMYDRQQEVYRKYKVSSVEVLSNFP